jgi:hypothetical protein
MFLRAHLSYSLFGAGCCSLFTLAIYSRYSVLAIRCPLFSTHYSLLFTTIRYYSVLTIRYYSLLFATIHYHSLPFTTIHYHSPTILLPFTTIHYHSPTILLLFPIYPTIHAPRIFCPGIPPSLVLPSSFLANFHNQDESRSSSCPQIKQGDHGFMIIDWRTNALESVPVP